MSGERPDDANGEPERASRISHGVSLVSRDMAEGEPVTVERGRSDGPVRVAGRGGRPRARGSRGRAGGLWGLHTSHVGAGVKADGLAGLACRRPSRPLNIIVSWVLTPEHSVQYGIVLVRACT